MACPGGGCGGKNIAPKKPLLAAAQRPTGNVISLGGKLTFGKPRISKGR